jgi:hypothetical protein
MTTATAAIANHLNIAEAIIASVEEWAHVLFVRFVGRRPRFVSKKVVKMSEWSNKNNLKINHTQVPYFSKWPGYLAFSEASDQLASGMWNGDVQDRYEVLYHSGGGIWSIAGVRFSMDDAIELASTTQPKPLQVIPAGYAITSTGEMVLEADWDAIEGNM